MAGAKCDTSLSEIWNANVCSEKQGLCLSKGKVGCGKATITLESEGEYIYCKRRQISTSESVEK